MSRPWLGGKLEFISVGTRWANRRRSIVLLPLLADAGLKIKYFPQPCQIANRITDERCICSESAASHSVNLRCHNIGLFANENAEKRRRIFIYLFKRKWEVKLHMKEVRNSQRREELRYLQWLMYTWSGTLKLEYCTLLPFHSEKEKCEHLDWDTGFKVRGTHWWPHSGGAFPRHNPHLEQYAKVPTLHCPADVRPINSWTCVL